MNGDPSSSPSAVTGEGGRPLNVTDALSYLDAVKMQFQDKPDVYNHFLDIMKDFKGQVIDTPGVIERVSMLFHGNPYLIQGFNTFLPPGYRIEISTDTLDVITVTTPMGQMTQSTGMYGVPMRIPREPAAAGIVPFSQLPPFNMPPPPVLPIGIGNGSRPHTPLPLHAHSHLGYTESQPTHPMMVHSPALGMQSAAASVLGNMNGSRPGDQRPPNGEFNHAIQYLNKIKTRYADDQEAYKQFLDILHTYQRESRQSHDVQVYAQVQILFKDAPDLLDEFKDFLPEAVPFPQGGLVGILPQPNGPSIPEAPHQEPQVAEKTKPVNRRRKRPEKEPQPPAKVPGGRGAKRQRTNQKPEPPSPKFSPYQVPHSPQPVPMMAQTPLMAPPHIAMASQPQFRPPSPILDGVPASTQDEVLFFERTKTVLESGGVYEDFLKLLNMFSQDLIDAKTLVDRAALFLNDELMVQFKGIVGWDDRQHASNSGPPGSLRTGAPDYYATRPPDDGQGPSYRRLPDSEVHLACSGRDRLCWSVLNDAWVSHPTWASEDAGFMTHKKNQYEETLHKSEEERHEFQVQIEALTRTIAILEPLEARLDGMTTEERQQFRLKPDLGGPSKMIYERIIKKLYGDYAGEVYKALQETPAITVPIVLNRLKRKDEDWRRMQREWNRTWREIDAKNFYKALDTQGISFKPNDKRNMTAKHLVEEIKNVKTAQERRRQSEPGREPRSLGHQLEYPFEDRDVLQDAVKLVLAFLDHSSSAYTPPEKRSVERFLRELIPLVFMIPQHEFDRGFGPMPPPEDESADETRFSATSEDDATKATANSTTKDAGVSAEALTSRLLQTALDNPSVVETTSSEAADRVAASGRSQVLGENAPLTSSPASDPRTNAEDVWAREIRNGHLSLGDTPLTRRPFFAGTTFYTLLRLVQLLYSRLLICKEAGAQMAAEKHAALLANPVAVELGLDEPNGPSAVLQQALDAVGEGRPGEEPNVLYMYLLHAWEKVFNGELDQAIFEEQMRWFFRAKAYHIFTLDRVVTAIVKQVQTVLGDNKCQDLWALLQDVRAASRTTMTAHDMIRYRREAERSVGSDEKLYRFDWVADRKKLQIQLVGPGDPSTDEDGSAEGRWREYCASYVLVHGTEWLPAGSSGYSPVCLKRNLPEGEDKDGRVVQVRGMGVQMRRGTYKIMYEAGTENVLVRRRRAGGRALRERAEARDEERRRRLGRILIEQE